MKTPREILIMTLLLFSASGFAQTVRTWVSTTGSDANPCSRTAPCRNLAAGITAVNAGGEVVVADSGGYGSVTVSKAVSIISPPGLHAAIAPTSGTALTVTAGIDDAVVLRGLYLNSQGATAGIEFTSGRTLHLESLVINGFGAGLVADAGTNLFLKDSLVRNNADLGVSVGNSTFASIDRVRLEGNEVGLQAMIDARVTVRDSVAAGNQTGFQAHGLNVGFPGRLNLESCMASNNQLGVNAHHFGIVMVSNCIVTNNQTGLSTTASSAMFRVTGSSVSGNEFGLQVSGGSTLASFGNNALAGNTTDGDFTATIPLQ